MKDRRVLVGGAVAAAAAVAAGLAVALGRRKQESQDPRSTLPSLTHEEEEAVLHAIDVKSSNDLAPAPKEKRGLPKEFGPQIK